MQELGLIFAIVPIGVGTVVLVLVAIAYGRLTGRHYPFRQFDDPNRHGAGDREPTERMGLSEAELTDILERYRQSFNLGVEDQSRLIGAAEMQAATHRTGPTIAAEVMSHSLITVTPDTPLSEVADLFRRHRFSALPVVGHEDRFSGVIFQMHLIDRAREDALRLNRSFGPAMRRLLDRERDLPVRATEIMRVAGPRATPETPLSALLPLMADGDVDAVPVLARGRICRHRHADRPDQRPRATEPAIEAVLRCARPLKSGALAAAAIECATSGPTSAPYPSTAPL